MSKAFTEAENRIMDKLGEIHGDFSNLTPSHPNELQEWLLGIHLCQGILMQRATRRDYPDKFSATKEFREESL